MLIILLFEVLVVILLQYYIVMPNPVVYYQKGRGKVSGYQQIAASASFIFSDLQNHNNDQFHEAISHLK